MAFWGIFSATASAHQAGDVVMGAWNRVAGTYNAQGQIVLNVCTEDYVTKSGQVIKKDHVNSNALDAVLEGTAQKTIVIPSGSTVELMNVVHPESNTTIIADGATLIMNEAHKGILGNRPTATNYRSLENVRVQGGTWQLRNQTESCSVFRFSHGNNVVIDGVTIISNYQSHAIALVAMKNTTVQNSTLLVQGVPDKNSVEEALQIDVATPKTAPALVQYGSRYVQGQTCKNIKVLNNTIEGSRGVCANFAGADGTKYKNKFHENIVIKGNTLTGQSAEGCVLYNTLSAVVKNNTITTNSSRKSQSYSVGLNITIQGKASGKKTGKSKVTIAKNTVYGYRQGIQVASLTSSRYKKAVLKNNKAYASSKGSAIATSGARSVSSKGNTMLKR